MRLLNLFLVFFRIGLIGFGGGYAVLSIILRDVSALGITVKQFADLTALDLVVPGPVALNASTYVGFLNAGVAGAAVATLGICAPVYLVVLTTMYFIERFKRSRVLQGMLAFVRPAAIGMIAAASMTIAGSVIVGENETWQSFAEKFAASPMVAFSLGALLIFLLAAVALVKFKINPILVTVLAAAAGAIFLR